MTFIREAAITRKTGVTGSIIIPVSPNYTHHVVAVEGSTGSVAVTFRPSGFTNFQAFSEEQGVIEEGTSATFVQGSVDALLISPESGDTYKITVSDY